MIWRGPMVMSALAADAARRRLGRARHHDRRHAARHRRRATDDGAAGGAGRRGHRLDAAGHRADRRAQGPQHVPEGQRAGARHHREHELFPVPALRRAAATSSRMAAPAARPRGSAPIFSARCRSIWRSARPPTKAARSPCRSRIRPTRKPSATSPRVCGKKSRARPRCAVRRRGLSWNSAGATAMNVAGKKMRTIWLAPDSTPDRPVVEIIDQTRLPHELVIARLTRLDEAARAIREMQVRGAPLIGATAAYGMALAIAEDPSDAALEHAAAMLRATRPTAVNLAWALGRDAPHAGRICRRSFASPPRSIAPPRSPRRMSRSTARSASMASRRSGPLSWPSRATRRCRS